jgi:hypothetical protein
MIITLITNIIFISNIYIKYYYSSHKIINWYIWTTMQHHRSNWPPNRPRVPSSRAHSPGAPLGGKLPLFSAWFFARSIALIWPSSPLRYWPTTWGLALAIDFWAVESIMHYVLLYLSFSRATTSGAWATNNRAWLRWPWKKRNGKQHACMARTDNGESLFQQSMQRGIIK